MSDQQSTGRPVELTELLRWVRAFPVKEWEIHANAGFTGIMIGDRPLFAAVDVTLGETNLAVKSVNGMRAIVSYIESLEAGATSLREQVERLTKERGAYAEALFPFATAALMNDWALRDRDEDAPIMTVYDGMQTPFVLTVGHFRKAAQAAKAVSCSG